jgi:hypothetical protein
MHGGVYTYSGLNLLYLKGKFSVSNQNNEYGLALSEFLKQYGITNFEHSNDIDNFVYVDDL